MIKREKQFFVGLLLILVCSLVLISVSTGVVSADSFTNAAAATPGYTVDSSSSGFWSSLASTNLSARWQLWVDGYDKVQGNSDQMILLGETLKWLVLIIVVLAVYSSLSALTFPSNAGLRFALSVIVGLLGTFMITTKELITALMSYGSLAITLIIALPFVVLLGFTILAVYKANAPGLFMSRILWAVYAIFLVFKAGTLLIIRKYFNVIPNADGIATLVGPEFHKIPKFLYAIIPTKLNTTGGLEPDVSVLAGMLSNVDVITVWVLLIAGILVFWFFVFNGAPLYKWLEKVAIRSTIESDRETSILAKAREKDLADSARGNTKL